MQIKNDFCLRGFEKIDKGDEGAVFVRYDNPQPPKGEPEIIESPLRYGGGHVLNYTISIPSPATAPRKVIACAIVTRTSKNCYTANCFNEKNIATYRRESLNALNEAVAEFFGL